jgi:hypothetical protein
LSRIPGSSPAYSSARSFRLSAAAKESKPLPRLAVLAGTSTEAMGGMPPEYRKRDATRPKATRPLGGRVTFGVRLEVAGGRQVRDEPAQALGNALQMALL